MGTEFSKNPAVNVPHILHVHVASLNHLFVEIYWNFHFKGPNFMLIYKADHFYPRNHNTITREFFMRKILIKNLHFCVTCTHKCVTLYRLSCGCCGSWNHSIHVAFSIVPFLNSIHFCTFVQLVISNSRCKPLVYWKSQSICLIFRLDIPKTIEHSMRKPSEGKNNTQITSPRTSSYWQFVFTSRFNMSKRSSHLIINNNTI